MYMLYPLTEMSLVTVFYGSIDSCHEFNLILRLNFSFRKTFCKATKILLRKEKHKILLAYDKYYIATYFNTKLWDKFEVAILSYTSCYNCTDIFALLHVFLKAVFYNLY